MRRLNVISGHFELPEAPLEDAFVQNMLSDLRLYHGRQDGKRGPRTLSAVRHFQRSVGLKEDGEPGPATVNQLIRFSNLARAGLHIVKEDAEAYNTHVHHYLCDLHEKHGRTFVLTREGQPVICVRGSDTVHQVLMSEDFGKTWASDKVSSSEVDYVMNLVQPMVANTVFNMHGQANSDRRKLLRPVFLGFDKFLSSFNEATSREVASWDDGCSYVDVLDACHNLLRANLYTVFFGSDNEFAFKSVPTFHKVMSYFVERYSMPCHEQEVSAHDEQMMDAITQASLALIAEFKQQASPTESSLVSLMLDAGLTEQEIAATIVNVMIAAAEAPASALAFTLQELSRNLPLQEQLRKEVDAAVGQHGAVMDHLQALSLCDGCVREGLRLFAPATLVQRQALCDTDIESVPIEKGQVVAVCITAVHRDSSVWPNPTVFDPTRPNLKYEMIDRKCAYVTFSGGPRGCPGKHLAVGIMKLALAQIVQQYTLEEVPAEDLVVPKFVEWRVNGIPVRLHRRPHASM